MDNRASRATNPQGVDLSGLKGRLTVQIMHRYVDRSNGKLEE